MEKKVYDNLVSNYICIVCGREKLIRILVFGRACGFRCAPSEVSDQAAHPRSLNRVFFWRSVGDRSLDASCCEQRGL